MSSTDSQREFNLRATYGMDQELIDALLQQHIGLDERNVALVLAQREPTQVADLQQNLPRTLSIRLPCAPASAPDWWRRSCVETRSSAYW